MKTFLWILGASTLGVAAYVVFSNDSFAPAAGADQAEDKVGAWGAKQRTGAATNKVGGKLKQGVGKFTGDDKLKGSGLADQASGAVKDAAGKAAEAISDTLHDLKS